jgi:hypothetical protein
MNLCYLNQFGRKGKPTHSIGPQSAYDLWPNEHVGLLPTTARGRGGGPAGLAMRCGCGAVTPRAGAPRLRGRQRPAER